LQLATGGIERRLRYIALPIVILGVRWWWVVGATSRPPYCLERNSVPISMYFKFIISAGGIASLGKKKKLSKLGPVMEKKVIPVETDTQKLVNYVCGSNLLKEGEDVKLKPDDEYPDWLWTLRTGEK